MWELDTANSRDLIDRLRPHARRFTLETAQVGERWRPLVEDRHERLLAAFPDYELLTVKQKYGALEFQAFPRRWAPGQPQWTAQEHAELETITSWRSRPAALLLRTRTRSATAPSTSASGAEPPEATGNHESSN